MDMDEEEHPLHRGHRHASEAEVAESSRSWTKAMYKHQEAANCFTQCLGLTGHPQANRAILLLISKHTKRFEEIRDKLAYNKSIKNILIQNGYNMNVNNTKINDEIYTDLRAQMQRIVSYSHKKIIIPSNENNIIINSKSDDNAQYKQKVNKYLEKCNVRKSINMKANDDKSMNINKTKIVLNDNFFNPDHQTLSERVKILESHLKNQTELINEYQNEIINKVSSLRQSLDHLYNTNNPNRGKKNRDNMDKKDNEQKINDNINNINNNGDKLDKKVLDSKEIQDIIDKKMNVERLKWENDKERLRSIHAKQLQELKKKIKDWMEYAKKQEKHAKIYKRQLEKQHNIKSNINNNTNTKNMVSPNTSHKGQIYHRGTLSRAKQNAIPESQEINQNDDT